MNRLLIAAGLVAASVGLASSPTSTALAQNGDANWATVKGRITWKGKAPEREKINVTTDKAHCLSRGDLLTEDLMVNPKNGGLANVFVFLLPKEDDGTIPIHPKLAKVNGKPVMLDQPCCMFEPRAIAIREGQVVIAKNSAPVPHNVRVTGNPDVNPGWNPSLPSGATYTLDKLKAQKLPLTVECNIHPWMRARIGVFTHPYFAVTDENGNFEIKLAPKGEYRIMIYHESGYRGGKAGKNGEPITIKGGQPTDLKDLEFNVKK